MKEKKSILGIITQQNDKPTQECPKEYIGESQRTFGDRLKEHLRNILGPHPPSINTDVPWDTHSAQNVSQSYADESQ